LILEFVSKTTSPSKVSTNSIAPPDLPSEPQATYSRRPDTRSISAPIPADDLPSWYVDAPDAPTNKGPRNPFDVEDDIEPPATAKPSQGFKLLDMVGRGGMGEVWSALQQTLQRPVAVKRMRRSSLTSDLLTTAVSEFRIEAMVAGRLEHPNIVPIHDLGADEFGRPLIAMKLVEGRTWNDIITRDFSTLPVPDFLAKHLPILLGMANAVAFAHDRGIVHRDLKPSQVMVGPFGEVMLMDWGLAIGWKDTLRTNAPRLPLPGPADASNPAGTPALMAPEQTMDDATGVGPHSDIFLLGGTLYVLLTGTYPYGSSTSEGAFVQAHHCLQQRPEERTPNRWIPKELADIAMKAMAREPGDRFASAVAFHDAVGDWMTGAAQRREAQALLDQSAAELAVAPTSYRAFNDIVHRLDRARLLWPDAPESDTLRGQAQIGYAAYALAKGDLALARAQADGIPTTAGRDPILQAIATAESANRRRDRQRRWAIRATFALLLAVALGGAAFTYQMSQSRADIARQRDRADRARHDSEELVVFMLKDLRLRLADIGRLDLMDAVVAQVQSTLQKQPDNELGLEERYSRILLRQSIAEVRRAQGNVELALQSSDVAVSESEKLVARDSDDPRYAVVLAKSLEINALLLCLLGKTEEGLATFAHGISIAERFLDHKDDSLGVLPLYAKMVGEMGRQQIRIGQFDQASPYLQRALERLQKDSKENPLNAERMMDVSDIQMRIGALNAGRGQAAAAGSAYRQAISAREGAVALRPEVRRWLPGLVECYFEAAGHMMSNGEPGQARALAEKALALNDQIVRDDPTNMENVQSGASIRGLLAAILQSLGDVPRALGYARESRDELVRITQEQPNRIEWWVSRITVSISVAQLQAALGDRTAATSELDAVSADLRKLDEDFADNLMVRSLASQKWTPIGELRSSLGQRAEAKEAFALNLQAFEVLLEQDPSNNLFMKGAIESGFRLADTLGALGEVEAALDTLMVAQQRAKSRRDAEPTEPTWRDMVAFSYLEMGIRHEGAGNLAEAKAVYQQSIVEYAPLVRDFPENWVYRQQAAKARNGLGAVLEKEGDLEGAMVEYNAYLDVNAELSRAMPGEARYKRAVGVGNRRIASLLIKQGKLVEAEERLRRAEELISKWTVSADLARESLKETQAEFEKAKAAQSSGG